MTTIATGTAGRPRSEWKLGVALLACLAGTLLTVGCKPATPPAVDTKAAERAVRDIDALWSEAAEAHDLRGVLSYYADDAIVEPPNEPTIRTKQAIHDEWAAILVPSVNLSWTADRVESSSSGDMVYETGTYSLQATDAQGNVVSDKGKVLQVWKKQANGRWKAVADMWSSDLPPAAPAPEPAKKK